MAVLYEKTHFSVLKRQKPDMFSNYIAVISNYVAVICNYIAVIVDYVAVISNYVVVIDDYVAIIDDYIAVISDYVAVICKDVNVIWGVGEGFLGGLVSTSAVKVGDSESIIQHLNSLPDVSSFFSCKAS